MSSNFCKIFKNYWSIKIFPKILGLINFSLRKSLVLAQSLSYALIMENHAYASTNNIFDKPRLNITKNLSFLLLTEDLDFAQSLSMLFRKDFHKVITVNDRETFFTILKTIQPNFIVIDSLLNESLFRLLLQVKSNAPGSKIYVFTSHKYENSELEHKIKGLTDKLFYQPIDLNEFTNQILYQSGD